MINNNGDIIKEKKSELKTNIKYDVLILHVPLLDGEKVKNIYINSMGSFSICNILNKNNISTQLVNLANELTIDEKFSIYEYIKNQNFKIVILSLHWAHQIYDTLEVARNIKIQNPEISIILGGYTASCFAYEILEKHPYVDYIIKGEGERPTLELVKNILFCDYSSFFKIPNLLWRNNNKIIKNRKTWIANTKELNDFDFIDYEKMKNHLTYVKDVGFFVSLGRGCLGNCFWCGGGYNTVCKYISGRKKISFRSVDTCANEIIKVVSNYKTRCFLGFDPYPDKQDQLINLIETLAKEYQQKIELSIECWKLPTLKLINAIENNLFLDSILLISPDFANEKLRKSRKTYNYTNKELYSILRKLEEKNIKFELYFIKLQNEPQEETIERMEMEDYIRTNFSKLINFVVTPLSFFDPYSPITLNPKKYNIKAENFNLDFYYNASKIYKNKNS